MTEEKHTCYNHFDKVKTSAETDPFENKIKLWLNGTCTKCNKSYRTLSRTYVIEEELYGCQLFDYDWKEIIECR